MLGEYSQVVSRGLAAPFFVNDTHHLLRDGIQLSGTTESPFCQASIQPLATTFSRTILENAWPWFRLTFHTMQCHGKPSIWVSLRWSWQWLVRPYFRVCRLQTEKGKGKMEQTYQNFNCKPSTILMLLTWHDGLSWQVSSDAQVNWRWKPNNSLVYARIKHCGNSCMSFQNWELLSCFVPSDIPSVPQILCLLLVMELRLLIDEMQMTCRERKDLDSVSSCQLFQWNHGMTLLVDLESETSSKSPKSTCHESVQDILNTDTKYGVKWSKTANGTNETCPFWVWCIIHWNKV